MLHWDLLPGEAGWASGENLSRTISQLSASQFRFSLRFPPLPKRRCFQKLWSEQRRRTLCISGVSVDFLKTSGFALLSTGYLIHSKRAWSLREIWDGCQASGLAELPGTQEWRISNYLSFLHWTSHITENVLAHGVKVTLVTLAVILIT